MPERIDLTQIKLTDGYLFEKEKLVREVTLPALYKSYEATGRVDALKLKWKRGEANEPHYFWDSDVAKWIEGAAYTLTERADPALEETIDALVNDVERGMTPEGYFNSHYLMMNRAGTFTDRNNHELYCAGHLMEAAVAYYEATGKRKLLDLMRRYAEYIEEVFVKNERPADFLTPGHEEIELALVKLSEATGERKYLSLAKFFVDERGVHDTEKNIFERYGRAYAQDHLPAREQTTAEGHAVRALYLYAGMADVARLYGDEGLRAACETLNDDIVSKKTYVTGGLGANYHGESFSYPYDLPNELAYAETCASIAYVFFAERMFALTGDVKYVDAAELMIYNAIPAGLSADGSAFFYTNPLEVHPERRDYFKTRGYGQYAPEYERPADFGCSCCPPNVIRFYSSAKKYMYCADGEKIIANLYGSSVFERDGFVIEQKTDYPWRGEIEIEIKNADPKRTELCLRIPSWCKKYSAALNGGEAGFVFENGYLNLNREWKSGDKIALRLEMPVVEIYANPAAHYDAGRVAVKRGPVVYCAEAADNGANIKSVVINKNPGYKTVFEKDLLNGVTVIECSASAPVWESGALYSETRPKREPKALRLIPYASWANRGRGEMNVWLLKEGIV